MLRRNLRPKHRATHSPTVPEGHGNSAPIASLSGAMTHGTTHQPLLRVRASLGAVLLLLLLAPGTAQAQPPELTVMTYNVNVGRPGDRKTLRVLSRSAAEVVFLQETSPAWERSIRKRLSRRFPYMRFIHRRHAGGLAVLSRAPFDDLGVLDSPTGWWPAWHLRIHTALGPIQVLNVHLRPPISESGSWITGYFTTAEARGREIRYYVEQLDPDLRTLIVGDFNERSGRASELLADRGMRSALMDHAPYTPTWRWRTPFGMLRRMLDHVWHDSDLDAVRAEVLAAGGSDHFPVLVTLRDRSLPCHLPADSGFPVHPGARLNQGYGTAAFEGPNSIVTVFRVDAPVAAIRDWYTHCLGAPRMRAAGVAEYRVPAVGRELEQPLRVSKRLEVAHDGAGSLVRATCTGCLN